MGVFLMLLGLTGMEKWKWRIEAISLAGSDEVVDVEVIGILTTGACIEVQFYQLNITAKGKRVLHTLYCPVD